MLNKRRRVTHPYLFVSNTFAAFLFYDTKIVKLSELSPSVSSPGRVDFRARNLFNMIIQL